MQHRLLKLAVLALFCLASTRVHGAPPLQPAFDPADFSHPLATDNPWLPLPPGLHIVYDEAASIRSSRSADVTTGLGDSGAATIAPPAPPGCGCGWRVAGSDVQYGHGHLWQQA